MVTALVLVTVSYVYYVPSGQHRQAVGLYFRNRFINQVFKRAPEFNATVLTSDTKLLLYWTPFFQNAAFDGFGRGPFAKCPVNNCVATNDRQYLSRARALLFHGADMSVYDLPSERASPDQLYVYYVHEAPPQLDMLLGPLNSAFNITVTYRRDSDVYMPYERFVPSEEGESLAVTLPVPPPAGEAPAGEAPSPTVAWVVSHCHTDGHREDYVAELRRYIAVDEFGACSERPCPVNGARACYQHLARSHLFYLSFENSLCRDYITEKFYFALMAGLIPVARGASRAEYEAVVPADAFIHVDDFTGPRELADHLQWLAGNTTALSQMRAWRHRYKRSVRVDRWCQLCEIMSRQLEPGSAVVPDLHEWWYDGSQCHN